MTATKQPKNRGQHFVPRHYLRQFSPNHDNRIGIASLDPFRFIGSGPIRGQCKANYFYEDSPGLDELLTMGEQDLSGVLRDTTEKLSMTDEELVAIRLLVVIFLLRTRKAAEIAKLFPKWQADGILKNAIDRGDLPEPPGGWRPGLMDFAGMSGFLIKHNAIRNWLEMQTLSQKFLVPEGSSTFFTSDHPVVLLNQLLDKKGNHRSFSGFGRSGFQLIFPLSPTSCLFFFDPKVYKGGGKRDTVVKLSASDVELVNSLQVQSADKCLLFSSEIDESEVEPVVERYHSLRQPIEAHLKILSSSDLGEEAVNVVNSTISIPSPWEFCRFQKRPRIGKGNRRDEAWSQFADMLAKEQIRDGGKSDFGEIMKQAQASI